MLRLANAPVSWGVEDPTDRSNPAWPTLLSELAAAGFAGTELGPLGYLPQDPATLRRELDERGLELVGGYVFEALHTEPQRALDAARRTGDLVSAAGGVLLVIIPGFAPERDRTAGRRAAAPPLSEEGWETTLETLDELARIAREDHGLIPVVHPHAGTFIEFADEIERLAADTDLPLCIDTGHCAYSGIDPVELYRRHSERVAYFHLKDVDTDKLDQVLERRLGFEAAVAERVFCPLGSGVVDFAGLAGAVEEHGFAGWATVEQDRLPTDSTTPQADAAASLAHLREVGLA